MNGESVRRRISNISVSRYTFSRSGPSIVVLAQPGQWTLGALVSNVWSVAGSGGRPPINRMTLQYFLAYNL